MSGGRFEFGVGAGWNREEMANHGTDPRVRMAVMRERVEAMKAIWTSGRGQLRGRVRVVRPDLVVAQARAAAAPAGPRRRGRAGVLDRVLAFGDAWLPNYAPEGILDRAEELRARADRPVRLMVMGVPADPRALEAYAAAGFERARALAAVGAARAGRAGTRRVRVRGRRVQRRVGPAVLPRRAVSRSERRKPRTARPHTPWRPRPWCAIVPALSAVAPHENNVRTRSDKHWREKHGRNFASMSRIG